MFDQRLFIFNLNLGVDLRNPLIDNYTQNLGITITLKLQGEIQQFWSLWNPLNVIFLFICEFLDLDIIRLVNFMIFTEIFISGIY